MLNDHEIGQLSRSWAIEPTNSKSKSWENGETHYHGWRENCPRRKRNVPCSRDRCWFFSRRNCSFRGNGETRCGNECNPNTSEDNKDPNVEQAHERTRRLVVGTNTENVPYSSQARSCHENETFNVGNKTLRERTGRPVVDHDNLNHEQTMLNEVNVDFRIPELSPSVVKHAQQTSVRKFIQKNENHPNRHALQQDLRQNQAYNPFSPESTRMIQDVGNIELFELLVTDPKTQCTVC